MQKGKVVETMFTLANYQNRERRTKSLERLLDDSNKNEHVKTRKINKKKKK